MEDQLLVALEYWREYRTQFPIAESWGISESTVCRIVQKVETLLIQSGKFRLPGKKQVYQNAYEWNVVLMDVAETPIERPKKTTPVLQCGKSRESTLATYCLGKKKRHTLKTQLLVDQMTGRILCTAFEKGRVHDFRLFKQQRVPLMPNQLCLTDKGYQGIVKLHPHSCTPTKKPRKADLLIPERQHNRLLAQVRVKVEHVIRRLKIFRILAERYRNRRKRFGLRLNLIAAILNYELTLRA